MGCKLERSLAEAERVRGGVEGEDAVVLKATDAHACQWSLTSRPLWKDRQEGDEMQPELPMMLARTRAA